MDEDDGELRNDGSDRQSEVSDSKHQQQSRRDQHQEMHMHCGAKDAPLPYWKPPTVTQ
jgi:hypothetical protein